MYSKNMSTQNVSREQGIGLTIARSDCTYYMYVFTSVTAKVVGGAVRNVMDPQEPMLHHRSMASISSGSVPLKLSLYDS